MEAVHGGTEFVPLVGATCANRRVNEASKQERTGEGGGGEALIRIDRYRSWPSPCRVSLTTCPPGICLPPAR